MRGGGKIQGGDMSLKDFMNQKKALVDKLEKQIEVEDRKVKKIEEEMQNLSYKRNELNSKMLKGYKKEDEIKAEIAALKREYETGMISSAQEKDLINNIKKLENSLPAAIQLN